MKRMLAIMTCLMFLIGYPALAGPITFGTWYEFAFDNAGSPAFGCAPEPATGACVPSDSGNSVFVDSPPWTFSAPTPGASFTITDAFIGGDAFNVFDFGSLILSTPAPLSFEVCGSDPDFCVDDPNISHGSAFLSPGSHSITVIPTIVAEIGAAYFRVDVPEPDSPWLAFALVAGLAMATQQWRKGSKIQNRQV